MGPGPGRRPAGPGRVGNGAVEQRVARRLIINADDFGFSQRLTDAIADCHVHGIITSTTLMVNMPAAAYAAERAAELPELGVGLHLNLTEGRPISDAESIPDLVDEKGEFPGNAAQSRRFWRGMDCLPQVRREIRAQVERCIELGVRPTHSDSHHGIHKMPVVRRALVEVLQSYGVPKARTPLSRHRMVPGRRSPEAWLQWLRQNVRRAPSIAFHTWSHLQLRRAGIRTPDWKATRSMGVPAGPSPKEQLLACIAAAPEGVSEILLHPGDHGPDEQPSALRLRTWAEDTPICRDPEVARFIEEEGIELVSFRDL